MEKDNKNIFATNLNVLMRTHNKSRKDLSDALGISYFTITAWTNGTKYPRMDKVEMLANYFGVLKFDLIEEPSGETQNSPSEPKLTEGEEMLLDLFRQIPEDAQKMYLEVLRASLKNQS
jgi:transcriptional regulator with XRE-family HTH domain